MANKTILGLDLGTTSIGWALVSEGEQADIISTGVRVIPLSTDESQNFEKGKTITTNADRTKSRSARRNLQRYKLRRENLIEVLKSNEFINDQSILTEVSNHSTFQTYAVRAKAANEKIELDELARVLLMINKKRGYKSSRKAKGEDEGQAVDGMAVATHLYENNLTPGQYVQQLLSKGKFLTPDFYRSDLNEEFNLIWNFQAQFYPEILKNDNKDQLTGKSRMQTMAIFTKELKIEPVELKGKLNEKKQQRYELRAKAVNQQIELGELVEVFSDINGNISNSSGYLGAISDRSKELYFNKITVGQFLHKQLQENPHTRLKQQVFYRQDYMDEFEKIWSTQVKYHPQLTDELKKEIRDIVIFYQRRLKSQKALLSTCEFESKQQEFVIDGKTKIKWIGPKVCPKSSPLFQEFKIYSQLNNIDIYEADGKTKIRPLDLEEIQLLFKELQFVSKLSINEVNKILGFKEKYTYKFKDLEGNKTFSSFLDASEKIIELSGHEIDFKKMSGQERFETIRTVLQSIGINTSFFDFDSSVSKSELEKQPFYQIWHLLYSYEGDKSTSGIESLQKILFEKFGFEKEYATVFSNIALQDDYSSLSTRAIQKILPFLREGNKYSDACELAGYNHSKSLTKEQLDAKVLLDKLEILPKNSLRNPVVEKIINQMINVINAIIDEYGKPDEIRIELARELKKSAEERSQMTKSIGETTRKHEEIVKKLREEFNIKNPSRNDVIKYKLYEELKDNNYHSLYSNTYIKPEMLFNGEVEIEHIIPQARLFDDSYSNKTLEFSDVNKKKSNMTAFDFVKQEYGEIGVEQYKERIKILFNKEGGRTKYRKLLWEEKDIPDNFINRDLGDTRYITKKAKEILSDLVRNVTVTTGIITDRLRQDWGLVDTLKEINYPKYKALGLVEEKENSKGQKKTHIVDWTKRNDHRHHAMDALTVAFTKPSFIQYLNNLNARSDKSGSIYGIEQKELYRDDKGKLKFKPPFALDVFRKKAKEHLENTLVSFKAKNNVTTKNKNSTTKAGGKNVVTQETPRGQLHLETVYGSNSIYVTKTEKVNASFDSDKIKKVANKSHREALKKRLAEFDNDPKKAFTGKNSLDKAPIFIEDLHLYSVPASVKLVSLEQQFTIRKPISPDLKLEKVVDKGIQKILQERLAEYSGNAKLAFSNLEEKPIYLNEEKGITIKSVKITGVANAIALHNKKDHFGNVILDEKGQPIPVDFVNTGNNHHVAIYRDEKGNLQEEVVSFMEAVIRKNENLPMIKKQHELGWEFLFTMKQNEYFVFPNEKTGFNPAEIDLLDPENYNKISPNLFRVQKISSKNYMFNHHHETIAVNGDMLKSKKELSEITYKFIQSTYKLEGAIKVRLNHLGKIVQVGEY